MRTILILICCLSLGASLPPLPPKRAPRLYSPKYAEQLQSFRIVTSRQNVPPGLYWDYIPNGVGNERSNIVFWVISTTNLPPVWKTTGSTTNLYWPIAFDKPREFFTVASSNRVTHLLSAPWVKLP